MRRSQNNNSKFSDSSGKIIGIGFFAVFLVAFMALNPIVPLSVNALEEEEGAPIHEEIMEGTLEHEETIEEEVSDEPMALAVSMINSTVNIAFSPVPDSVPMTPTSTSGAAGRFSVVATVRVQNSGGYSLYFGSDSNTLTRVGGTETIEPISGSVAYDNLEMNTWGYAYAEGSTIASSVTYSAVPSTLRGTPIWTNNSTNIEDETKTYTLSFAAKIGGDKPAGTYQNQVTMSVVSSPKQVVEYSITYNANGGTGEANPATQVATSTDDTYEFTTTAAQGTLAKSGYTFLGWAESSSATTATYTAGTSKISLTKASPSKTLFAVWKKNIGWDTITELQQMQPEFCTEASTAKTLIDNRDGNSYTVARLTDGKCWMTQNLSISPSTLKSGVKLNRTNTDLDSSVFTSDSASYTSWAIGATGDSDYNNENIVAATNRTLGAWYSWCATTAGTCQKTDAAISANPIASSSVCPRGWRLPTASDFYTLYNLDTSTPIGTIDGYSGRTLGGVVWPSAGWTVGSSASSIDQRGYYWSSTAGSTTSSSSIGFGTSGMQFFYPSDGGLGRGRGKSLRCVAR